MEVNILSMGGHMHGFGTEYSVRWLEGTGDTETIYDVPVWEPSYRYDPPVLNFEPGELVMAQGDALETECTWFNDTDELLGYPDEMCTTFGVAYPLEQSFHCDDGVILGDDDDDDDDDTGVEGGGELEGTVRRTATPVGDGVGTFNLSLFLADPSDGAPVLPFSSLVIPGFDLSASGAVRSYQMEGLPVPEGPIFIHAFLDDDDSGVDEGPNTGDLVMVVPPEQSQVQLIEGEPVVFDIVLDTAIQ